MTSSFQNKTAIITGAAIGIGREIARQLLELGTNVILNDLDEKALTKAVEELNKVNGKCVPVAGDSSQIEVIHQMVEAATTHFDRLDFAICNAGITTFGTFLDYSPENFDKITQVNLKGSFFLAQAAARQFISQESAGRIIFISSVTGFTYHTELNAYGMSKAALNFLAKSLGVELAAHRITVNAVAPGATITERTSQLDDGGYKEIWSRITPSGRPATSAEIANAVLFLLDEKSSQITGQTIVVDGGWTSTSPPPH